MKRRHCISLLIILAGIALSVWLLLHPRPLPYDLCGDIFLRYKDTPGIKAAFLKDYPLDDTTTLDVTMLQAQDSATWSELIISLCHNDNKEEYLFNELNLNHIRKDGPAQQKELDFESEYMIISYFYDLTVGVFPIESKEKQDILIKHYINLLTNQSKRK